MTKNEFMKELSELLRGIPGDEQKDALQYYEDYFAEAGIADNMTVPESLGTPSQVADKIIQESLYNSTPDSSKETVRNIPANPTESKYYENITQNARETQSTESQRNTDSTKIVLAIVIGILTFPIWIGVVAGVGGAVFGILAALAGMAIGLAIAGVTMVVAAFLASSVSGGLMISGIGLILLAVGILCFVLVVLFCGRFLPWVIKGIAGLIRKLFGRKE